MLTAKIRSNILASSPCNPINMLSGYPAHLNATIISTNSANAAPATGVYNNFRQNLLEIGHTPVLSSPLISEYFGIKNLTIKDESANRFGTHKDRKSRAIVLETINRSFYRSPEALCIMTAGNAGLSLAKTAGYYGLPVIAFVAQDFVSNPLHLPLENTCEQVISLDLEDRFWSSQELCNLAGAKQGRRILDATNGVIKPFESIVDEICLLGPSHLPDIIVLPVGSGELFLGIAKGLKRNQLKTRLIGVAVHGHSIADKLYAKWNPYKQNLISATTLGSPHHIYYLNNENLLLETFNWLKTTNLIKCEPSSAATFAALHKVKQFMKPDEKVLVINTGTFNFCS